MQIASRHYFHLAKGVGLLVTLMGLGTLAVFVSYVATGQNALAADLPELGGVGLLLMASLGAFALPLGASLFGRDPATAKRVRIAAGALALLAVLRLLAYLHPELRATLGVAPLVEFFVLGAIALVALSVRPDDEAAIELRTSVEVEAPAEEVWRVLADDFGDVGAFASSLRASSLDGPVEVGATRVCEVAAVGPFPPRTMNEKLVQLDPRRMKLAYEAGAGMPAVIRSATNRWSVEPLGDGRCRAHSRASIEVAWWALPLAPLFRMSIGKELRQFGEELRLHVEQGALHPRKLAQAGA